MISHDVVMTTGIIKLEIMSGARTQKEFQRLRNRFEALNDITTKDAIWQKAYELGFTLRRKSITIPHTDILIAAVLSSLRSYYCTCRCTFDVMAGHTGITVESLVHIVRGRGL